MSKIVKVFVFFGLGFFICSCAKKLDVVQILDKYVAPSNLYKIEKSFERAGREWEIFATFKGPISSSFLELKNFTELSEPEAVKYVDLVRKRFYDSKKSQPVLVYSRFDDASGVLVILLKYDTENWACYLRRI